MDVTADAMVIVVGLAHSKKGGLALGLPISDQPLQIAWVIPVIVFPKDYKFIASLHCPFNSTAIALCDVLGPALWGIVHP